MPIERRKVWRPSLAPPRTLPVSSDDKGQGRRIQEPKAQGIMRLWEASLPRCGVD